jgi:flagellar biosynthesis/type III secretory pathway ATPase
LAARNHYPAIDVLNSVSRVMPAVTGGEHRSNAALARRLLAAYEKARDLINIGAYVRGSDPEIDAALEVLPALTAFLQQNQMDFTPFDVSLHMLETIQKGG